MGAAAVAQLVPLVATTGMSFYQMAQAKKSAEKGRKSLMKEFRRLETFLNRM